MRRSWPAALAPTFRYWMQTEVHVYAFSVAANVLLSFYPFLIVMMSVSRLVFNEQTTIASIQLALRDYFPDSFTNFLYTKGQHENLPPHHSTESVSIMLLLFTANGISSRWRSRSIACGASARTGAFSATRLVSLALIFACGALALVSMMLTASESGIGEQR